MEGLSEEERRALRGSKFAPLPPPCFRSAPNSQPQHRFAHPAGPMKTNKAAALAKFLERKLQDPEGLASIDPDILQLAVKNAKRTVLVSSSGTFSDRPPEFVASGNSKAGSVVRHVSSFGDSDEESPKQSSLVTIPKKKKLKKKNKKQKIGIDDGDRKVKGPKKKL